MDSHVHMIDIIYLLKKKWMNLFWPSLNQLNIFVLSMVPLNLYTKNLVTAYGSEIVLQFN